jgi:hypothetical protein
MKYLVLYSFIMLMSNCNKYDNTLAASQLQVPRYTESGVNTFGCFVNGAAWANFGETKIHPDEGFARLDTNKVLSNIDFISPDTVFSVSAFLTVSKQGTAIREEYMSFELQKKGNLKGIHKLSNSKYPFEYANLLTNGGYGSIIGNPFTITIYKDSIVQGYRHIVSGMFNGTLYSYNQTDSVKITGGVFDVIFP